MEIIDKVSNILITLIAIGGTTRIIWCLVQMINSDETETLKKKINNILIFIVLSSLIFVFKQLMFNYFYLN